MCKQFFLGIDGGTSYIKASIMDSEFNLLDEEREYVSVYTPFDGASEIDMSDYWKRMCRMTHALKARNPNIWDQIAGVGVTGQGDGLWPVDEDGNPVRNAILWNDTRSRVIDFEGIEGLEEAMKDDCTNAVYAGSVTALLKWMKLYEPENFRRIRWALHCKDWLNFKLTGKIYTDYTDASTSMFNIKTGEYSQRILDVLDLSECRRILPEVVESTRIIGHITREVAELTGIREGTPVIEGAIDVCTVALGTDVMEVGNSCTIIGTTLSNQIILDPETMDQADKRGLLMHNVVPGTYLWILPTLSGASTMDFIKAMLFADTPYPELEEKLKEIPIGCDGLIYHPYICGERAPFKNPFATAGFFGLTQAHSKLHMMRSVFEGLACSFYDCFQAFGGKFNTLYLSGGASVSPFVCQMFSDVIGKPASRIEKKEMGVLGIIRVLQVALGYVKDYSQFPRQKVTVFQPDMDRHAKYMEVFRLFKELQEAMAFYWKKRSQIKF